MLPITNDDKPLRLLFRFKRRYMNKDVVLDKYGRLFELPTLISGNDCHSFCDCVDYSFPFLCSKWYVGSSITWRIQGLISSLVNQFCIDDSETCNFDVIVASSDCISVVLGDFIARKRRTQFVIDLYDNYESFGLAKIPFVRRLYRRALKRASAITCVSEPLAEYIRDQISEDGKTRVPVVVIESTIGAGTFIPRDKQICRSKLALPAGKPLIGYAGALDSSRDIEVLYAAFASVNKACPEAVLVLAGAVDGTCQIPCDLNIQYLGELSHEVVADLYGALDVGVICLKDSEFGRYAFPQKAYEMISMRIPLAVTNVGAMGRLFDKYPEVLYEPGDSADLERVILNQLANPMVVDMPIPTWEDQAKKMKVLLESVVGNKAVNRDASH